MEEGGSILKIAGEFNFSCDVSLHQSIVTPNMDETQTDVLSVS
jgi:hypothetical protein